VPDQNAKIISSPGDFAVRWYVNFNRFLLAEPSFASLSKLYGGPAILEGSDPRTLLMTHKKVKDFLHQSFSTDLRQAFASTVNAFAKRVGAALPPPEDQQNADLLNAMRAEGYGHQPDADPALIGTLLEAFREADLVPARDTDTPIGQGDPPQPPEILRRTENLAHLPTRRVLELPGLLELIADPGTVRSVGQYLGAPPIVINVSAWQSFAGEDGAKEARDAQLFHYDLDDYRFCKLFIYLTDVDGDAGPHVYVPQTHRPDILGAVAGQPGSPNYEPFMRWYVETLRKTEEDVFKWFGRRPITIEGKTGSRFLVNTEGLHRGMPPARKDRIILQCTYAISPWPTHASKIEWHGFRNRHGKPQSPDTAWMKYLLQPFAALDGQAPGEPGREMR
jgi:hypothetical protein